MTNLDPHPAAEASLGELVSELSSQTSRLVRDELRLAQKELQQTAKHGGIGVGLLSVAGVLGLLGLATFVAAAICALALVLPAWAAALIIGGVLVVTAGVVSLISRAQVRQIAPAPQTVASVKKDIQEVKDARRDRN